MLSLYVVIRAGSFSCHAVGMPSLCEYYDLYARDLVPLLPEEQLFGISNGHLRKRETGFNSSSLQMFYLSSKTRWQEFSCTLTLQNDTQAFPK